MPMYEADITVTFHVEGDDREDALRHAQRIAEHVTFLGDELTADEYDVDAMVSRDPIHLIDAGDHAAALARGK